MELLRLATRIPRGLLKLAATVCCTVAMAFLLVQPASAAFTGDYDLSKFTFTNSNFATGSVQTPDSGLSVILTGSNTGSGIDAYTDITIAAKAAGTVSFEYFYDSLDDPGYDVAGYLLGSTFIELSSTAGQSGTVMFPVLAGDIFGFRVITWDNTHEPGILAISEFSAPAAVVTGPDVPEPGTLWTMFFAAALIAGRLVHNKIAERRRALSNSHVLAATVCLAAIASAPLVHAQGPVAYTGKNATGELSIFRTVNALQLAQTVPMNILGARSFEGKSETLPKIAPRLLHPPLGAARMSSLAQLGAAALQSFPIVSAPGTVGFNGLTHADQRLANNGNQLSLEPPNPAIAVANGYVLEGVNNAIQVYDTNGKALLPRVLTSNEFFGIPPSLNRSTGVYGPFPTDMRVFYDAGIDRFMVLQRVLDVDVFGNTLDLSHLYLAVSQSGDPRGSYTVYSADTTHPQTSGCPCFSDYPQIGADQYGFYISANEYGTYAQNFVDATILAISKTSLATGSATPVAYRFTIPFSTGYEFAIQPATTPPGASYFIGNGGVEYFASTVGSFSAGNTVAVWALANTSSLAFGQPSLTLSRTISTIFAYSWPDLAIQPPGPRPYGTSLVPAGPLPFIDSGDTRALSLFYAGGRLHLSFSTKVTDDTNQNLAGGAYVVLSPALRNGVVSASVISQNYLSAKNNHLLFPVVAVNAQGKGVISTTLVGKDWFPSAAYVPLTGTSAPTTVRVVAPGTLPEDGFTGYNNGPFPGLARWGDYSAATISPDGKFWVASEYIGNLPRTEVANWQTFVAQVAP